MRGRRQLRPSSHGGFTPLKPPRSRDGDQHHLEESVKWTHRAVWAEGVKLGCPVMTAPDAPSPPKAQLPEPAWGASGRQGCLRTGPHRCNPKPSAHGNRGANAAALRCDLSSQTPLGSARGYWLTPTHGYSPVPPRSSLVLPGALPKK